MTTFVEAFAKQLAGISSDDGSHRVYFIGHGHDNTHNSWEVLSTTAAEIELLTIEWELMEADDSTRAPEDNLPRLRHKGYPLKLGTADASSN